MFEWLQRHDVIFESNRTESSTNFKVREFKPESSTNKKFSILTQFFSHMASQNRDAVTSLFISEMDTQIIEEIIVYFDTKKIVYVNNEPAEIMLSKPNQASLVKMEEDESNLIIKELFNAENHIQYEWKPQKTYKVVADVIQKYEDEEFDKVLNFIKNSSQNSPVMISLSPRLLQESLKNSLAIRYFANKCKNVHLWMDDDNLVTYISVGE